MKISFGLGQALHLVLFTLLFVVLWSVRSLSGLDQVWPLAILSVVFGVAHQLWIALGWGLELYHGALSRLLKHRAFGVFSVGFGVLFIARFALIVPIAVQSQGTLALPLWSRGVILSLILLVGAVALHSVLHYFGIRRALGIDHFDPSYRDRPLVREGVFRYTRNAMYTMVLLLIYPPVFIWGSLPALVLCLFHHALVWVHYFSTERPNMAVIYGTPAKNEENDPDE